MKTVEKEKLSWEIYSKSNSSSSSSPPPPLASNYTYLGDRFRQIAPLSLQCSVFCGGKSCKYENTFVWKETELALANVYSHWITEDLLAMSRPHNFNFPILVKEFIHRGIKSVFNLQCPGEHGSCGPQKLLSSSGFTYDPIYLMNSNIYFYNFGTWRDYDVISCSFLLDMVQVLCFSLKEGKVAIHCHAGLGRTGVFLSCYFVFRFTIRAVDAVRFLRFKRPGSVSSKKQIDVVRKFEIFCRPQLQCFGFTSLDVYMKHQKRFLHGFEARKLANTPQIVFIICERLLILMERTTKDNKDTDDNPSHVSSIVSFPFPNFTLQRYSEKDFSSHLQNLKNEDNASTLLNLLFVWLEDFKIPVLDNDGIISIIIFCDHYKIALSKLPVFSAYLIEYLIGFTSQLISKSGIDKELENIFLLRLIASLTHRKIWIQDSYYPINQNFVPLQKEGTERVFRFLKLYLEYIRLQEK